jgi:hypothetical protein
MVADKRSSRLNNSRQIISPLKVGVLVPHFEWIQRTWKQAYTDRFTSGSKCSSSHRRSWFCFEFGWRAFCSVLFCSVVLRFLRAVLQSLSYSPLKKILDKNCLCSIYSMRATWPAHLILLDFITLFYAKYKLWSTS